MPLANYSSAVQRRPGANKKGYHMATLLYMFKKTKIALPYDFPLSHHQLLFNIFTLIIMAQIWKYFFLKANRMIVYL